MINGTELRVGNLINYQGKEYKATMLGDSSVAIYVGGTRMHEFVKCEEIEPIPLTPEWLERMGFKWNEEDWRYFIQVGNTLYIEFEKDFDCSITPETWRGSSITPWADIKHVHQLQNVYFALTGEELKLKDQ